MDNVWPLLRPLGMLWIGRRGLYDEQVRLACQHRGWRSRIGIGIDEADRVPMLWADDILAVGIVDFVLPDKEIVPPLNPVQYLFVLR